MRIIHTADIHLDSKLERNLSSQLASSRRAEILENFVSMVEYASANDVDAILISGDLFDVKKVSANARNRVLSLIFAHSDIDFYYLKGNHDINSFLEGIEDIPSNLFLFTDEWKTYSVSTSVCISGIEIDSSNNNTLYDSLFLPLDKFNIVMLHGQAGGYISPDKAEAINLSLLKNKNIDYLALGHVHSHKEEMIDGRCLMVYPGCLDPRGFDECGEHGFVLLDIDEEAKTCSHRFVSFASRNAVEINADLSGLFNTYEAIEKIDEEINEKGVLGKDLLKLVLTGQIDVEADIDLLSIQKRFESGFFMFKIYDQTSVKVDFESYLLDKSLKGEFVRVVMARDDLSEEKKSRIISYGLSALRNEGIELCD
ncbi:MAG: metallophosphoesterase family protein [Lachnospiraceae bacterium]|nr:metallophosphoesterase family protein [Lachnospiraceae bacterium]